MAIQQDHSRRSAATWVVWLWSPPDASPAYSPLAPITRQKTAWLATVCGALAECRILPSPDMRSGPLQCSERLSNTSESVRVEGRAIQAVPAAAIQLTAIIATISQALMTAVLHEDDRPPQAAPPPRPLGSQAEFFTLGPPSSIGCVGPQFSGHPHTRPSP